MENVSFYEPPVGGRINSPKLRGIAQFVSTFEGLPAGVSRFDLLKLVKNAGPIAGFTPKMIQLLEYYILFTRDCDWTANSQPIVFQALSKTAQHFGVSERQIQRLENDLFKIGALTWNDSGNHRRYGVRSEDGEIMHAFGVDLTPLAALRASLESKLVEKQRLDAAWMETKRQISWYRRQLNGLISEAGEYASLDQIRFETEAAYKEVAVPIRVYMTIENLHNLLKAHKALHSRLLEAVRAAVNLALDAEIAAEQRGQSEVIDVQFTQNPSSMDDSIDVNKYSTTYNQFDKSNLSSQKDKWASERSVVEPQAPKTQEGADSQEQRDQKAAEIAEEISNITIKQVLYAASERFKTHLPVRGRQDFPEIVEAASSLLPALGIHKSAWAEACKVLGRNGAAICVLIIDQKLQDPHHRVRNPGGYLREMTARAGRGELNLHRSVFGLLKRGERKHDA